MNEIKTPAELGLDGEKFPNYLPGQTEAIGSVIHQFEDKDVVLLDGPTGCGKSLIAIAVAKLLHDSDGRSGRSVQNREGTLVAVVTNQLRAQYRRDFGFLEWIAGRNNFPCGRQPELSVSEGPCISESFDCEDKYRLCPYYIQKRRAMSAPYACTNLHYFLYEANFAEGKVSSSKNLLVVDEGHLLENTLMGFLSISLSRRSLQAVGIDFPELESTAHAKAWAERIHPVVNHEAMELAEAAPREPETTADYDLLARLLRYQRMRGRLTRLADITAAKWLISEGYAGYTLKPFFVDEYVGRNVFTHAEKTLLMSATFLSKGVSARILGLAPSEVGWHQMDSNFPVERRPFNYVPVAKINRSASDAEYDRLAQAIDEVLERHRGEKGVIHTVSFKVRDEIMSRSRFHRRMITHRRAGESHGQFPDREEAIQDFLDTRRPRALISPSVDLGLDLHDDLARWQVIAKVPWLNLGDPQIRFRQQRDSEWYAYSAMAALVQAYGRSTRHRRDWSTVYHLDSSLNILINRYPHLLPDWWASAYHRSGSIGEAPVAVH